MASYNYDNRLRVDTFHPSVNVALTTRNENDVTLESSTKRNRASFHLANSIQGSDVIKVSYLRMSRVIIPVSWFNVTATSYFTFIMRRNDDDNLISVYKVTVDPFYYGQWSIGDFVTNSALVAPWIVELIGAGDAVPAASGLPFTFELQSNVLKLIPKKRDGVDGTVNPWWPAADNQARDYYVDYNTGYSTKVKDYLFKMLGVLPDTFVQCRTEVNAVPADVPTNGAFPGVADVRPYKLLRIHTTSVPQNTPVTSKSLPNPLETVPVEANFGETIVFEPTQAFAMMVPQLSLQSIDVQIVDEYGQDIDFNGADWSIGFIIDFESRSVDPPVGGLVMPRKRATDPMEQINKRRAVFEGEEGIQGVADVNPSRASRAYYSAGQQK